MDGFITRDGMVALQHYNTNPCTIKIKEDNVVYSWTPKHNVSLAWVQEKHVPKLLSLTARMCCGKRQRKFHPASLINVNLWTTGNRHGVIEE